MCWTACYMKIAKEKFLRNKIDRYIDSKYKSPYDI